MTAMPAAAQPVKGLGTFTVNGKTTTWKQIYVSRHEDVDRPSQHFLIVLLADRQVPRGRPGPRTTAGTRRRRPIAGHPDGLARGLDGIATTAFHRNVEDSGRVTKQRRHPRPDAVYDERELEAQFKSKMLGQDWHFNAFFKGRITQGAPMKAPDMDGPRPTTYVPKGNDPSAIKREVGSKGFEWTNEGFFQAVAEADVEAVRRS